MNAASVDPERLLKELRALWRDLGKQDPAGVLRACAMTLIVVADEAEDSNIIGETIASLIHEHPSRAIVVRVRQCAEPMLEARVFAQCWMPFGSRQQICCEQVEIIASPASLGDVATVVRALIVPDLPSILCCPSESLWRLPQFRTLLPLADKLIVDSCGVRDSALVFDFLSTMQPFVERCSDLVWSRLTPWRQAIARLFEDASRARHIYDLSQVRILYKASDEPSSIYYLAGWFMHVLGAGVSVKVATGVGPEYVNIAHVALSGKGLEATVEITERNTAETRVNGETSEVTVFPVANEEYALRQELSVAGRDPLFEDVLGLARLIRGRI
jgi:glucose-6-phosphate dehydrogenase assembly protein OpcA